MKSPNTLIMNLETFFSSRRTPDFAIAKSPRLFEIKFLFDKYYFF